MTPYFSKIMTVPVNESSPKNPMPICFIENREILTTSRLPHTYLKNCP